MDFSQTIESLGGAPVIILVVCAMVGFFVFQYVLPGLRKAKQVIDIVRGKSFASNSDAPVISSEKAQALLVGCINGEQQSAYIDSLATGLSTSELSEGITHSWGIRDTQSALSKLNFLREGGHRDDFDILLKTKNKNAKPWKQDLQARLSGDVLDGSDELVDNFVEGMHILEDRKVYQFTDAPISTLAWDLSRLVFITRASFDLGYIDENQAWEYIEFSLQEAKAQYPSWEEFGTGYLVGRAMWGGNDMALPGMVNIVEALNTDAESPWSKTPLR